MVKSESYNKDLLMISLSKFYSNISYIQKILPIIVGKSPISLRLIDWFVTNYSKKSSTIITYEVEKNVIHFNVYLSYRSQLKAYSKQQFDPFRRRDRINFYYNKDNFIETTIGQLNFFRWVIQNNILEYIENNFDLIETDMVSVQKKKNIVNSSVNSSVVNSSVVNVVNKQTTGKKRLELSKSFLKNMNTHQGVRVINFS